jgi:enamine deaminase RidA (YjgF/YER057c/UK114 family)
MAVRYRNPPGVAAPISNYSHAATVPAGTKLLFISGQGPTDERGELVGRGDIIEQAEQVFENIRRILADSGAGFEHLVKMNLYVIDFSRRPELAALRGRLFGKHAPISTAVQVSRLAIPEWLIEIECVAEIP